MKIREDKHCFPWPVKFIFPNVLIICALREKDGL